MVKPKTKAGTLSNPKSNLMPYLGAAVICEKTLEEKDKVVSVMRIVDTIGVLEPTTELASAKADGKRLMMSLNLTLFLFFRAGDVTETLPAEVVLITPRNRVINEFAKGELEFGKKNSPTYGINLFIPLHIDWDGFGMYWYEVKVNGISMTKVPLLLKPPSQRNTEDQQ